MGLRDDGKEKNVGWEVTNDQGSQGFQKMHLETIIIDLLVINFHMRSSRVEIVY